MKDDDLAAMDAAIRDTLGEDKDDLMRPSQPQIVRRRAIYLAGMIAGEIKGMRRAADLIMIHGGYMPNSKAEAINGSALSIRAAAEALEKEQSK